MIKRPLHQQFGDAVLEDRKITTIRRTPWPIGKPIMLFHWAGVAYRSKHVDVAAVVVVETCEIRIAHRSDGRVFFDRSNHLPRPLWDCEGFASQAEMDQWFRSALRGGAMETRHLMRFNRVGSPALPSLADSTDADEGVGAPGSALPTEP